MNPTASRGNLFDPIGNVESPKDRRFYGKYRGVVLANVDTDDQAPPGRVQVYVDHIPGAELNWAMPCVPYAGTGVGLYMVPPVGAWVWVEFEAGDPSYPVWSGCFWDQASDFPTPKSLSSSDPTKVKMLQTGTASLVINDTDSSGGLTLTVGAPAIQNASDAVTVEINASGVKLTCAICTVTVNPQDGVTVTVGATKMTLTQQAAEVQTTNVNVQATNTSVKSVVSVEGNTTIKGTTAQQGPFSVQGTSGLTGNVTITGATSATGDVNVTGNTTLTGNTTHAGQTTLGGATTAAGAITAAGAVTVAGPVTVGGPVTSPTFVGILNGTVVPPPV